MGWTSVVDAAADLVLGARCPGCGRAGIAPCRGCCERLRTERPLVRPLPGPHPTTVISAGVYAGALRSLLIAAKEDHALGVVAALGERLAVSVAVLVAAGSARQVVLVPIPSDRSQVARRGLDFTAALARSAAIHLRRAGVEVRVHRCLGQSRHLADQAGLGVAARRSNLDGAYVLRRRVPVGPVIVVDDIVTTGASLAEAIRVLTADGHAPLGAATVAATPLRRRR